MAKAATTTKGIIGLRTIERFIVFMDRVFVLGLNRHYPCQLTGYEELVNICGKPTPLFPQNTPIRRNIAGSKLQSGIGNNPITNSLPHIPAHQNQQDTTCNDPQVGFRR